VNLWITIHLILTFCTHHYTIHHMMRLKTRIYPLTYLRWLLLPHLLSSWHFKPRIPLFYELALFIYVLWISSIGMMCLLVIPYWLSLNLWGRLEMILLELHPQNLEICTEQVHASFPMKTSLYLFSRQAERD
jgi:hypothetical protein